jgi:hypothetical protein
LRYSAHSTASQACSSISAKNWLATFAASAESGGLVTKHLKEEQLEVWKEPIEYPINNIPAAARGGSIDPAPLAGMRIRGATLRIRASEARRAPRTSGEAASHHASEASVRTA